jgi:hypothetical protein
MSRFGFLFPYNKYKLLYHNNLFLYYNLRATGDIGDIYEPGSCCSFLSLHAGKVALALLGIGGAGRRGADRCAALQFHSGAISPTAAGPRYP